MILDDVVAIVSQIAEQPIGPDDDLFESGMIDSLGLIDVACALGLDLDEFDRERWGTCRKLKEVIDASAD